MQKDRFTIKEIKEDLNVIAFSDKVLNISRKILWLTILGLSFNLSLLSLGIQSKHFTITVAIILLPFLILSGWIYLSYDNNYFIFRWLFFKQGKSQYVEHFLKNTPTYSQAKKLGVLIDK